MFPDTMSAQEVVDAINEAYYSRVYDKGNQFIGHSKSGLEIKMYLNKEGKIISAFPLEK